jgi:hypothetical protein
MFTQTVFEVSWGDDFSLASQQIRYFTAGYATDAVLFFAKRVVELDGGPAPCAFAVFRRLPDTTYPGGIALASWAKTSNEHPASEGSAEIQ